MPYVFNVFTGKLDFTNPGSSFDPHSPGPIGDVTPSTGAFSTISSTPGNDATGLIISGGTITGAGVTPFATITGTWNTTGSPSGIFANFVNTASGGSANVIDLQVDGVSMFSIGKDGVYRTNFNGAGNMTTFAEISTQAGGVSIKGQVRLSSEGNGILQIIDASTFNSFNRLAFGGTDANYPSIKRSTTIMQARLADDSAFTVLQATLRTSANAVAEVVAATHTLVIQDASGISYKVLAVAA